MRDQLFGRSYSKSHSVSLIHESLESAVPPFDIPNKGCQIQTMIRKWHYFQFEFRNIQNQFEKKTTDADSHVLRSYS